MAVDAKYGAVQVPGIPEDEPIFILRAQDALAPDTIMGYRDRCIAAHGPTWHAHRVGEAHHHFVVWQNRNGRKMPDTAEEG